MSWKIVEGDCIESMRVMATASVDAIVTDPPYGLGFMGRTWDDVPPGVQWAVECLRVLKPGGHLLAFGGTRTYHRLTCAIEDAGFEIRDTICWLYGSGFPKSLDVSKAIDKRPGVMRHAEFAAHLVERRLVMGLSRQDVSEHVVGARTGACWNWEHHQFPEAKWWPMLQDLLDLDEAWDAVIAEAERVKIGERTTGIGTGNGSVPVMGDGHRDLTASATPDAEQWQGWGTALKPAHEPIVVARKPLAGTVAANVLVYGTGALNVDGCRIGSDRITAHGGGQNERGSRTYGGGAGIPAIDAGSNEHFGRWPANVILDERAAEMLDEQTGELHSQDPATRASASPVQGVTTFATGRMVAYDDSGGASRFFYVAKAGSAERNAGLDGFKAAVTTDGRDVPIDNPYLRGETTRRNVHPTVKPIDLMRWLVRLVTPPGGTVLDMFAGSGTTGCAAVLEGFDFIGLERESEYVEIAKARIAWWAAQPAGIDVDTALVAHAKRCAREDAGQVSMLGLLDDIANGGGAS